MTLRTETQIKTVCLHPLASWILLFTMVCMVETDHSEIVITSPLICDGYVEKY